MKNPFEQLKVGNVYSNIDIKKLLAEKKSSPDNPAAYTYNRINEGMTKLQPFFVHIAHGEYEFIGPPQLSKYCGIVLHHPKDGGIPYQIGTWDNGEFSFLDSKIKDIKSWKEGGMNGEKVILINLRVLLNMNGLERKYSVQITEEKGVLDESGCLIISVNSKLGSLLIGKKEGDLFLFGENKIEILKIY